MANTSSSASLDGNAAPYFVEHAKSVALILAEEFGTPFMIYEAATGNPLPTSDDRWRTLALPERLRTDLLTMAESGEPHALGWFRPASLVAVGTCGTIRKIAARLAFSGSKLPPRCHVWRLRRAMYSGVVEHLYSPIEIRTTFNLETANP